MEKAVDNHPERMCLPVRLASRSGGPLTRRLHSDQVWEPIGLGWMNFQVSRRTHASLGHHAKVDPKVSADQRGHGIGVALDVYTKSSMKDRATAAKKLEDSVSPEGCSDAKRGRRDP